MFKTRPKKLVAIAMVQSLLLITAGFDFYQQHNLIVATVFVFAGVSGISMLRKPALSDMQVQMYSGLTNSLLFLVNAVVLLIAGKKGLPYMWALAAALSGFSAFKAFKANKNNDISAK